MMNEHVDESFALRDTAATTAGFAVGDRVRIKDSNMYGKVTWVGGCGLRNLPACYKVCDNVEVEWMRPTGHRSRGPAWCLEHVD